MLNVDDMLTLHHKPPSTTGKEKKIENITHVIKMAQQRYNSVTLLTPGIHLSIVPPYDQNMQVSC